MFLNWLLSKFAAKLVENEMQCLKVMYWPALTGKASIFNLDLLCYWPTIHHLTSKICPKFQVLSSHAFEVDELHDEQWSKIVESQNISTPIYVECSKMYWSKVCVQDFWYFVPGLDIQPEQSENDNPACKKSCDRLLNTPTSNILFFSVDWLESIA